MPSKAQCECADWPIRSLGEVAEIVLGGTPSTDVPAYWDGSIPWMSSGEVNKKRVFEADGRITEAGLAASNATLVDPPSVAIGLAGQGKTRGTAALVNTRLCTNQSIALIKGRTGVLDTSYLFHNLDGRYDELRTRSAGGGRAGLSREILAVVPIALPDLSEQSRIAAELDTVDEAITKTEAVIAKLRQMRAGLLHDLLTRGLDHNGELRDPIAHPEQFQESPLGQIPREWSVRNCQSLCREIVVGIVVKPAQYYVDDGVPVLRSANIRESGIQLSDLVFISPESNMQLSKSMLHTDDVVTVRTGYPGTTCVVPSHLDGANCVDLIISRPAKEIVPKFLALWVNSSFGKDQVLRVQGGLAQQHFNVGEMKTLLVARPEPDEQKAIVERLETLDMQITVTTGEQAKLTLLKSGLMTDLLTGRVRVPLNTKKAA